MFGRIQEFCVRRADRCRMKKVAVIIRNVDWHWNQYRQEHYLNYFWIPAGRSRVLARRLILKNLRSAAYYTLDDVSKWLMILHLLDKGIQSTERSGQAIIDCLRESATECQIDIIGTVFECNIPEAIVRKICDSEENVISLRRKGHAVPADILDPLVEHAAESGELEKLRILYGTEPPEQFLHVCMEAARTRNIPVAVECAQVLRDYRALAEILSVAGTPHEMLTAKLYLEGRVPESELS
ncbi:MAG: hypothetical protein ABIA92_02580 [Patescibacteria group bacterium]